ncbi:MAG: type II toxin-antitoxin system PemK/MazF family toxin [Planctomycetota bacterium]
MNEFRSGDVIMAEMPGPRGAGKVRPALIFTVSPSDGQLVVLPITTSFAEPPPVGTFPLPWAADGLAKTGLTKRSAVVTDWLVELDPNAVDRLVGFLPRRHFEPIRAFIAELE